MISPKAVLAKFDKNQLEVWKNNFKAEFYRLNELERTKFKNGEIPFVAMTPEKVNKVLGFLDQCTSAFQVEAMEKLILKEYDMPETFSEIDELGSFLMSEVLKGK